MSRDPRTSRANDNADAASFLSNTAKSVLLTAGVAALANLGRKMAVQAPTAMASDWADGLAREHAATLAAIDKLVEVPPMSVQRRTLGLTSLKHMIAKHALQEENVVYPMLRREESEEAFRALHEEHGEVKAMLFELGDMDKSDPAFEETLMRLRGVLEEHMRKEEEVLFPALRARLSEEENRKLARAMNMAGVLVA